MATEEIPDFYWKSSRIQLPGRICAFGLRHQLADKSKTNAYTMYTKDNTKNGTEAEICKVAIFSPENGDITLLQNVNIEVTRRQAPKLRQYNNVYSLDSICALYAPPPASLNPWTSTSNGRRAHRFAPTIYMFCSSCWRYVVERYWLLLRGGIIQTVPCTAVIFWSTVRPHLSPCHSWFIHEFSLENTSRHTYKRSRELARNVLEFSRRSISVILRRVFLTSPKILRHGAEGSRATDFYRP
jgi:hypothetical protein